jgi:large subunit ribosomal protein L21
MYAIVEIAGKQFRVAKDMKIKVPLLDVEPGKSVDFDQVMLVEDDKGDVKLGTPVVGETSVTARVIEHGRDPKIIVFKKKRRKGYQKKRGHRQDFSLIEITGIGAAKKTKAAPKEEKKAAAPAVKEEKPKTAAKVDTAKKPVKKPAVKKEAAAPKAKAPAAKKTTTAKPKTSPAKKTTRTAAPKKDVKED